MILFIDDEPKFISAFVQAFELSEFSVKIANKIDDAFIIVEEETAEVDCIILDVMMPPGLGMDLEDTKDGLRTGLQFLKWLKKHFEEIPVVLLTNLDKSEIQVDHRNCEILEKKYVDPWGLVEKISLKKRRKKLK